MMPDPKKAEYVIDSMLPAALVIFNEASFDAPSFTLNILKDVGNFYQCLNVWKYFWGVIDERSKTNVLGKYLIWILCVQLNY